MGNDRDVDRRDSHTGAVTPSTLVESISLDAWRERQGLTWRELAERIGAKTAGQAQAWALGRVKPSARRIEAIRLATDGAVDAWSMHRVRLAWERENPRGLDDGAHPASCDEAA